MSDLNQRLRDLVRYMRGELHDAGLITREEYTDLLSNTPGAVKRLEDYDAAVERVRAEARRAALAALLADMEKFGEMPCSCFPYLRRRINELATQTEGEPR